MNSDRSSRPFVLGLRAGELVEVRSASEILATLDRSGTLDALPFMPEMMKYCGKRFPVFKRSHKTCDTIEYAGIRRMQDTVHLEGLRCDGEAHGGCEAGCLLYWNEAWLRRVEDEPVGRKSQRVRSCDQGGHVGHGGDAGDSSLNEFDLHRLTVIAADPIDHASDSFRCQATEIRKASVAIPWWDPRQYIRDVTSGNVSLIAMIRAASLAMLNVMLRRIGLEPFPHITGACAKTPRQTLGLKPGELVRVKSRREIVSTLDENRRNRGLSFDFEMVPYCAKTFPVLRRVGKIINEKTGKMMHLPNDCVVLDGVTCTGHMSRGRLFCPRAIQPYWREIWLERVKEKSETAGS
jgi:hypothetical protein